MSHTTFGAVIKEARKTKQHSQRELSKLVGIDFTYLSKLENNRSDYAPKEGVIRKIAEQLELNAEELIFLAGRLPSEYQEVMKSNYQAMPTLFRRMRERSLTIKE